MFRKLLFGARPLSRVWHDTSGGALIYTAILIPSLIGFVGLGVDVALWHLTKRETQTMADSGAISAAQDFIKYGDMSGIVPAGTEGAVANNFDTTDGNIAVNNPPVRGVFAGDDEYIEVILDVPADNLFSSLFIRGNRIESRAVTHVIKKPGDTCLMALDPDMDAALDVGGTADVSLNCGAVVNSTSDIGANIYGTSCFESIDLQVSGGADITANDPDCTYPTEVVTPPQRDPLRTLEMPNSDYSSAGCSVAARVVVTNGQTRSYPPDPSTPTTADSPYIFCNSVVVNSGGTLNFSALPGSVNGVGAEYGYYVFEDTVDIQGGVVNFGPGLYIFLKDLKVAGGTTLLGSGVTFYFGPDSTGFSLGGGAANPINGNLSAPGLDPDAADYDPDNIYNGMLIIEDPDAGPNSNKVVGTTDFVMDGIVYTPNSALDFAGTSGTEGAAFIANNFDITGTSDLGVINSIIIQNLLAVQIVDLVE